MLIYLLRHGLTQDNQEKRYQGRRDVPLCPQGLAQLRRADFAPKGSGARLEWEIRDPQDQVVWSQRRRVTEEAVVERVASVLISPVCRARSASTVSE